jgi:hypothetical protein
MCYLVPLPHKKNKKSQDDSVNSHTSESDENNEKIQQQEATPTQLKSDKETTTPKQKITEDVVASPLFSSLGVWLFANVLSCWGA